MERFLSFIFLSGCVIDSAFSDGGFRQVALNTHNEFRAKANTNPLELSSQLNIAAHERAEKLASNVSFETSDGQGYSGQENIWAHFGELRPLAAGTRDAVITWYTNKPEPPIGTLYKINPIPLYSNTTKFLGIGVGTSESYTVVIAYYL